MWNSKLEKIHPKISLFLVARLLDLQLTLPSGVRRSAHNYCQSATRKIRSLNLVIPERNFPLCALLPLDTSSALANCCKTIASNYISTLQENIGCSLYLWNSSIWRNWVFLSLSQKNWFCLRNMASWPRWLRCLWCFELLPTLSNENPLFFATELSGWSSVLWYHVKIRWPESYCSNWK